MFHLNIFSLLSIFHRPQMIINISVEEVSHGISFSCTCIQGPGYLQV